MGEIEKHKFTELSIYIQFEPKNLELTVKIINQFLLCLYDSTARTLPKQLHQGDQKIKKIPNISKSLQGKKGLQKSSIRKLRTFTSNHF